MIQIRNGKLKRDDFKLENINLDILPNSFNIIVGKNSAGKSSLLYALTGSILLSEGTLQKDDIRMAYVANDKVFKGSMAVWNIPNAIKLLDKNFSTPTYRKIIRSFNIDENDFVLSLSQGQQKLVMLAVALARDVDLLLLDEINLNIDSRNEQHIVKLLEDFVSQRQKSVIVSTNKLDTFEALADQLIYIKNGGISFQGNIEQLKNQYTIFNGEKDAIMNQNEIVSLRVSRYNTEFLLKDSAQGSPASVFDILSLLEREV